LEKERRRTGLLYPVFPVVRTVIPPPSTRNSTVPHHKEWHHLGDDLAFESKKVSGFTGRGIETDGSARSDSPEVGFEGMFFAWGTVLWTSS